MIQVKRICNIVLFIALSVLLQGCGFGAGCGGRNIVDDVINGVSERSNSAAFESARGQPMTKANALLMQQADEARAKMNSLQDSVDSSWWPWHPFKNKKISNLEKSIAKYESQFATNIKYDSVFQQTQQNQSQQSDPMKGLKKYLPFIVVIIVILAAGAVFLLLMKKKPTPEPATAPAQPQAPAPIQTAQRSDQLSVDYTGLLASTCSKAGVSKDAAIKKFGNERSAYEAVNQMVGKGMSSEDIAHSLE